MTTLQWTLLSKGYLASILCMKMETWSPRENLASCVNYGKASKVRQGVGWDQNSAKEAYIWAVK